MSFPLLCYLNAATTPRWNGNASRALSSAVASVLSVPPWAVTLPFAPTSDAAAGVTTLPLRVRFF